MNAWIILVWIDRQGERRDGGMGGGGGRRGGGGEGLNPQGGSTCVLHAFAVGPLTAHP